jgi:hypothetical protein
MAVVGETDEGHPFRAHFDGEPSPKDMRALHNVINEAASLTRSLNAAEKAIVQAAVRVCGDWERTCHIRSANERELHLAVQALQKIVKDS